ncbi:MAG: amidohydrolase family protein [Halobacteria archaeon]
MEKEDGTNGDLNHIVEGRIIHVTADRDVEVLEGEVVVEEDRVSEINEKEVGSRDVVMPALVNAHTHIGDSLAKTRGRGLSLEDLVAPPDGLKHRILRNSSREAKVEAMSRTVEWMRSAGIGSFVDFREGGVEGVEDLRDAVSGSGVRGFGMGRGPPEVLEVADGYGASGSRDGEFSVERKRARKEGKPFGIHAGEVDPDDIDGAFEYDPDFLVHMVHAREKDFDKLDGSGTPVVVCPRCNMVTDVGLPPVERLNEVTDVALGTDNVMLNSPSVWREMEFVSKYYELPDDDVLRMATVNGGRLVDGNGLGVLDEGVAAQIAVLDGDGVLKGVDDVVAGVVRRAGEGDVKRTILSSP